MKEMDLELEFYFKKDMNTFSETQDMKFLS